MKLELSNFPAVLPESGGFAVKTVSVYVDGDTIAAVGGKPEGFAADRVLSGSDKQLLIPGLINTHTHSYMSFFRNCADDLPFNEWLFDRIMPLEDMLTGEDAYWGTLLSCLEMLRTGTTCFADMHMFKTETPRAVHDAGMRAVLAKGLVGSYKNGAPDDGGRLQDALENISFYKREYNDGLVTFFLAPHAIYTCDHGYLRYVADTAGERGLGVHIHVSEGRKEVDDCLSANGMTPVALLEKLGVFKVHTLAAHCVHITDGDIDILSRNKVSAATNPISNMKLGNGFAPVPKLLAAGVNVSLGTDSAASNNSLNMFGELAALALIHKGNAQDSTAVSAADGLAAATRNGAKALRLATGSLAPGHKADMAILDLDTPNFYPRNNLISALSYSADGSEVETVIVGGRVLMEKREYKTIDAERVYFEVNRIAERLFRNSSAIS